MSRGLGCGCNGGMGLGEDPGWDIQLPEVDYNAAAAASNLVSPGYPYATAPAAGTSFLSTIAQDWTKIAGNILAPQTTYTRDPKTGALTLSTPANQTANAALLTAGSGFPLSSSGGGTMLPLLLVGGLGLALLVMSKS